MYQIIRSIGLARTRLQQVLAAITLNLVWAMEWLTETSHDEMSLIKKRQSHFGALEKAIA